SRKDRLGQLLENWNTQVDGFQNDMSTLQEGFDIPIKFEYDLQQLYDQIDQIKTKIQNGGKAGRDEYANLLGLNEEVIDKLESQTGVDKITDDYFDTLQKGIEEASSAIDEKIKSGNYSDDDIVELQKTLQDRQDAYQQVLQAFNDWGTNNQIDFTTASGEDLQQYWNDFLSEPHELKIDAKIENKDTVDNMLSEMASGSTITFTANVDEVEQTVTAVKDEEGNITYYGDVSDPETQVYYVKDQDGTIYFSGDTDAAVDAVNQTKENVENSQSNFLVGADTSSAIASINAAIIAAHEGRGVIQVDGDLSPFQKTWNKVAGFLNKLGGNVPTFSASTKSTKTVGTKSTGNYSNKRLSMQEARLEQQNRGSSSKNNSSVSKNNKKKNSNVSYLGNSGGAGNKKGNLTSKSSKKPDSSSGKSGSGSGNKGGSGSGSSSEPQEQDYNWIETLISRIQRQVTNLGKTVSATYKSWSTRNNALAQELGAVNNEISVQQQAYNKYMQLANSVSLPENYASLVRNGALDVSTIADDDLNEKIKKYKEYYEAALESADAVTDLQDQLAELAKTKFDSVTSQFEAQLKVIEQEKGMYETFLDETETAGYLASTKYYEYLISTEKKNIDALKNEFNSLSNAMGEAIANGKIEQGSEQWNDMQSSILDVQTSIEDANKSLLEYQKNLRQLKWDTFDKTEEYIGKIQDESNFLIDLMSNQTLYDDKTGKDTKYATAIKGLHAVNYNAYMTQADDYAKEIQEIDKEMANDPYNKDLLERRQELLASQQEAIKNAEEEKQSIKSLVKDGYDAQLDALQKLIDKYKDSINSIKDLYDYQKNIKEQTDSLAALQKQREALGGDNSEETQSKLQQLDKQIADAKSDLQDTEYQQYLSDQEKLLDNFYSEAEEWINARLDDLDGLIQQEIDSTNANSAQINQTITDETQKVGYTITDQMKSIWNSSDGFTAVVSNYCNGFQNTATSILDAVNYIKGYVEQLKKKADAEAAEKARQAELARQQAAQKAAAAAAAQKQQQASSSSSSSGSSSSGSSGTWGSWFIHKADSYPKNRLKTETSIVDRLKYHDIDSSFARRKQYYEAMGGGSGYTGSSSQNRWLINQLKSHGYAKGTKSATKGIHLVGEDANEIGISKGQLVDFSGGETVFNGDMTKTLWKFADNPSDFMTNLVKVPTLPKLSSSANSSVDVGGVNIVMNGVNDVQTFSKQMREALADSAQTQKMFRTFVNKDSIEFKKYK
ncbi:MAG TPA: hypothetical protein DCW90_11155, partial [Lachnospiraceae bacterium]|nr:hypothetical protein [Lachnospiraceae bacterium]